MQTKFYQFLFLLLALMLFNSCGGDTKTWGIDSTDKDPHIPVCNGDRETTTNALVVKAKTVIRKEKENTILRILHFQSGEKRICVVQGKAIIYVH